MIAKNLKKKPPPILENDRLRAVGEKTKNFSKISAMIKVVDQGL